MKLGDYIRSLPPSKRDAYAKRCGTTPAYLNIHILHSRKEPRRALREALARESEGMVSIQEVLEHFGMSDTSAA